MSPINVVVVCDVFNDLGHLLVFTIFLQQRDTVELVERLRKMIGLVEQHKELVGQVEQLIELAVLVRMHTLVLEVVQEVLQGKTCTWPNA